MMTNREKAEEIVDVVLCYLIDNGWGNKLEAVSNEVFDDVEEHLVCLVTERLEKLNA